MINGRSFFDQTVKIALRTYDNILKPTSDQGNNKNYNNNDNNNNNCIFTRLSLFSKIL